MSKKKKGIVYKERELICIDLCGNYLCMVNVVSIKLIEDNFFKFLYLEGK